MRLCYRNQKGYSLIELMIGLLVGLIVLSAVIYSFLLTVRANRDVRFAAMVNQEMTFISDFVSGEMRRIGFNSASTGNISQTFSLESDCLMYVYDKHPETPGFGDEGVYAIKWADPNLYYGSVASMGTCSLTTSNALNSVNIRVFDFNFESSAVSTVGGNSSNYLEFVLGLEAVSDDAWNQTVSKAVKVRNDEL